jgi:hypothetical protein
MKRELIGVSGQDRLFRLPERDPVTGLEQGQIVLGDGTEGPVRSLGTIRAMRPKWDKPGKDDEER